MALAEILLCFGQPFPRINGIAKLLHCQLFARNIDDSEPIKFFLVRTLADIDHQLVFENLRLFGARQIVKSQMVNGKIALHILADADCALLSVKQLIAAIVAFYPIHDVQRELLVDGSDNFITLLVFVDKLTLKGRANIQLAAVSHNAVFGAVYVAVYHISYRNFMEFNFHLRSPAFFVLKHGHKVAYRLVQPWQSRTCLRYRCLTRLQWKTVLGYASS